MFLNGTKFTFNDFTLTPQYTNIDTREDSTATETTLFGRQIDIPVISSPMDSVTGTEMMLALHKAGSFGIHHRYCDFQELFRAASFRIGGIAISPSLGIKNILDIHSFHPNTVYCIDVSHGHSQKVLDFCKELINNGITNIISGNVATCQAVYDYLKIGINHIRVGIGSSGICSTRLVTGFGYPQASAVHEIYINFENDVKIISDGGCNTSGDVVKALSLGANYVMTGRLFAGTDQCPIKGCYRGMASKEALSTRKDKFFVEGESIQIEQKGDVKLVVDQLKSAIQAACYYGGIEHFSQLVEVPKIMITNNAVIEGQIRK